VNELMNENVRLPRSLQTWYIFEMYDFWWWQSVSHLGNVFGTNNKRVGFPGIYSRNVDSQVVICRTMYDLIAPKTPNSTQNTNSCIIWNKTAETMFIYRSEWKARANFSTSKTHAYGIDRRNF
jgi:hypothetical protein